MTDSWFRALRDHELVTDYPEVLESAVVDDEGSDEVGVRRIAVLKVRGDGVVQRGVSGREDGRIVDQSAEEFGHGGVGG